MRFSNEWQALVFTVIDRASGYHQMRMAVLSRQYTAFRAGCEIYQLRVAPMAWRECLVHGLDN